jgi:hypothetical protein
VKFYSIPTVQDLRMDCLKAKTQGASGESFELTRTGDLGDDDACGSDQNFNAWLIENIQEGANIQVIVTPDDTSTDNFSGGTDLVLSVLDANNNYVASCVDANGVGVAESANFVAPNTGVYEIHVHNNDFGNCNTCNPTYTLQVSGDQAEPISFTLESSVECDSDTCAHDPIN